jgi:putative membrane protein
LAFKFKLRYFFLGMGGLGFVLLVGLIAYYGFEDVGRAVAATGWGLGLVVLTRAAEMIGAAKAWSFLFPSHVRISGLINVGLRLVREGINTLLPVAQVGGEFIGARLLRHCGVPAGAAAASVIVDLFIQAVTQVGFTLTGLTILILLGSNSALVREVMIGLIFIATGLTGFFFVQRLGGFGWVERQIARMVEGRLGFDQLTDVNERLVGLHNNYPVIAKCVSLHLMVWFSGASEIWIALKFMGQSVTVSESLVIESLSQALRSATFVVPASLGVQEGGLIALCAVFQLPPTIGLALSLVKRVAELAIGVTGLVIWHALESRLVLQAGQQKP